MVNFGIPLWQWQPTPVLLPGKFHGRRSLIGYSPWDRRVSDMTERLHFVLLSLVAQLIKNPPTMRETWVQPWVGKIPWRRKWQPIPVFLPGKFHGLRSLVGYSSWGCKESDTTEQLHFLFFSGELGSCKLHSEAKKQTK